MTVRFVRLAEVCDITMGQAPIGTSYNQYGEGYALIAGAGDFGAITPNPKKYTSQPTRITEIDDIILCIRATIGDLNWSDKRYCLGRGVAGLRPNVDELDKNYLWHFIQTNKDKLSALGTGSTFKQISRKHIENFEIPLPSLDEQKRITTILDKANELLSKRERASAQNDELLRSVFLDIFGDPVSNPKRWEIINLEKLCDKITDGTHHSPEPQTNGIPYITAKHLRPNNLDFFCKPTFVSQEAHETIYSRCNPKKNDVLYIKDGATAGAAAINQYEFQFSMLSSLALIKTKDDVLLPEYLCDWLNNEGVKYRILSNVSGAAITRLTIRKIKDIMIELPPVEKQIEYKIIRSQILKNKINFIEAIKSTNDIYSSLTQRAFLGQLSSQQEVA